MAQQHSGEGHGRPPEPRPLPKSPSVERRECGLNSSSSGLLSLLWFEEARSIDVSTRTVTITKFRRVTVCARVTDHRNFRALFRSAACRAHSPGGDFSSGHCSDCTSLPQTDCRQPIASVPSDVNSRYGRAVIGQDRVCTYDLLAAMELGAKRRQPVPMHRQFRTSLHRRLRTISHDFPSQSVPVQPVQLR